MGFRLLFKSNWCWSRRRYASVQWDGGWPLIYITLHTHLSWVHPNGQSSIPRINDKMWRLDAYRSITFAQFRVDDLYSSKKFGVLQKLLAMEIINVSQLYALRGVPHRSDYNHAAQGGELNLEVQSWGTFHVAADHEALHEALNIEGLSRRRSPLQLLATLLRTTK